MHKILPLYTYSKTAKSKFAFFCIWHILLKILIYLLFSTASDEHLEVFNLEKFVKLAFYNQYLKLLDLPYVSMNKNSLIYFQ